MAAIESLRTACVKGPFFSFGCFSSVTKRESCFRYGMHWVERNGSVRRYVCRVSRLGRLLYISKVRIFMQVHAKLEKWNLHTNLFLSLANTSILNTKTISNLRIVAY